MAHLTDSQKQFLEQPLRRCRHDTAQGRLAAQPRSSGSTWRTACLASTRRSAGRSRGTSSTIARASLIVVHPTDMHKWLAVDGRAEVTTEGADAQIDKLAKKYLGVDDYPNRVEGEYA